MADYVAIQNENLEPGAPWISATAFALRDNPIAIAEGAPGAPRIAGQQGPAVETGGIANSAVTQPKMSASSVGRSQLRTETNSASGSLLGGGGVNIDIDDYSFFPTIRSVANDGEDIQLTASSSGRIRLVNTTGNSRNYTVSWRYITS